MSVSTTFRLGFLESLFRFFIGPKEIGSQREEKISSWEGPGGIEKPVRPDCGMVWPEELQIKSLRCAIGGPRRNSEAIFGTGKTSRTYYAAPDFVFGLGTRQEGCRSSFGS
jgi:hypothetical protein